VDLINFTRDFLRAAKNGNSIDPFLTELLGISEANILKELEEDTSKKVFWINLYNAFVLIEFRNKSKLNYDTKVAYFQGISLSLDEIEHGVLRGSKSKLGLGYFRKWNVSSFEKLARVNSTDYRVHFALNCGANSCPPIFVFSKDRLDDDLDLVTQNYLLDSICFKQNENVLKVPRLCLWYFCDFGGFKGIQRMLKRYNIVAPDVFPKIGFLKYDRSVNTNNFSIQIDA
jgi:hypothetical protein